MWVKNANYVPLNLPLVRSLLFVDPFHHCHIYLSLCRSAPCGSLQYRLSWFYLSLCRSVPYGPFRHRLSCFYLYKRSTFAMTSSNNVCCQYALQIHRSFLCQDCMIWYYYRQCRLPWLSSRYTYSLLCGE